MIECYILQKETNTPSSRKTASSLVIIKDLPVHKDNFNILLINECLNYIIFELCFLFRFLQLLLLSELPIILYL